jgi:hypothetical protein
MKVIFGNREIELKSTDIFLLDVDGAQSKPIITQDEFVAFLDAYSKWDENESDDSVWTNWGQHITAKYHDLYDWDGGVYGVFLLRNGIMYGEHGRAITKDGTFCKQLFEETIAA